MPIVRVKGVANPMQFPDDMDIDDIKAFLQKRFTKRAISGESDALSKVEDTASPYNPSLVDKIGSGIAGGLKDAGLISDNYRAQQIGKNLSAIGEFLPGVGDATAGDDFGRAAASGDKFGMGLSALGVIPVVGDLAKKSIKTWRTSDGYKYFELPNGKVVDNLDPDLVDMEADDISQLRDWMGEDLILEGDEIAAKRASKQNIDVNEFIKDTPWDHLGDEEAQQLSFMAKEMPNMEQEISRLRVEQPFAVRKLEEDLSFYKRAKILLEEGKSINYVKDALKNSKQVKQSLPMDDAGDFAKKLKPHQVSPTSKEWSDFDFDEINREAFGVTESDVTRLKPSELNIKWTDDLDNVEHEIKNSGKTRKEWAEDVDLSTPIDVILEDGVYKIDDGHHRYTAAKILGKDLPVSLQINDQPFVGLAKRAEERGEEVHPAIMKAAVDRGFKPSTNQSLPMDEVKSVTSYNDMFDFTPEQMAQQLRSSKPENVIDGVYVEPTKFGEKRFNPDGSIEIVKEGKVLRKIEPQDSDMAYKNKIMKNESEKPEVKAIQEKRKADFDAERARQQAAEQDTYKMQHTAPTREDNSSGDDLTDTFGEDIYSGRALQYFGTGSSYDGKAINIIQGMRGNPEKSVTIYRAVPKDVKSINSSDWVTTTKEYAQDHMEGEKGWHILSKKVKAKDIATDGNSIHEFGYDPSN